MSVIPSLNRQDPAAEQARRDQAYEEGKRDARHDITQRGQERDAAARRAYERGRRDERARHPRRRGSPLFAFVGVLALAALVGVVYLGVREGSFARGGQVVDQNLAGAAQSGQGVADRAGDALQNAGAKLKGAPPPAS